MRIGMHNTERRPQVGHRLQVAEAVVLLRVRGQLWHPGRHHPVGDRARDLELRGQHLFLREVARHLDRVFAAIAEDQEAALGAAHLDRRVDDLGEQPGQVLLFVERARDLQERDEVVRPARMVAGLRVSSTEAFSVAGIASAIS
jgi:hypothetical protein